MDIIIWMHTINIRKIGINWWIQYWRLHPTPSKQLSLIVDELEDTIKLEIVSDNEDNNFIKSITNLIRFINELQYPIIKII